MKIVHRVPVRQLKSDPVDERYQAEVDRSTSRLEKEYAAAERRYEAAVKKAQRAQDAAEQRKRTKAKDRGRAASLASLWAEVELRRDDLARIKALMMPAGASTAHRGRKSYRPVPIVHGNDL